MMKTSLLLPVSLSLILLFSFTSCKKDPTKNEKLPPITHEGKNTIGFTIDGEVWVPYYKCSLMGDPCGEIHARYSEVGGAAQNRIAFGVNRIKNGKFSGLSITSVTNSTITSAGNKTDSISVEYQGERLEGYIPIFRGPLPGSKFTITKFNQQNQIIAGEFEFILREYNGSGKTISIKDGRFDFKFNACECSR